MISLKRRPAVAEVPDELSPARRALAAHLTECKQARQRLADLGAAEHAAEEATRKEAAAQAAVDAVAEAEAIALHEWSTNPACPMPTRRAGDREKAILELAPLKIAAIAARRDADAVGPLLEAGHRTLALQAAETPKLIRAVLLEEAEAISARYYKIVREGNFLEAVLVGFSDCFQKANDGVSLERINRLMSGGLQRRDEIKVAVGRHRESGRALADRLTVDPKAKAEIEP